ncbi:hypothetical protein PM082_010458 [Marasmius tenuissimus]|nr:hypothetical protein PM082_010458 [Marasmius tenuissimus]
MGRVSSTKHELPANPTYKIFERSDGNSSRWPKNTECVVESGNVNWMQHLDLDHPLCIKWRCEIGAAVAKALSWPEGPTYVLADWPSGYRFYCHNKGAKDSPRQDPYLFGSRFVGKFRSPNEFIPHARWLFTDPTMNPANCECKYCAKRPQREVTFDMGNEGIIETPSYIASQVSASPHPPRRPPKPPKDQAGIYASVQKAPKPLSRSAHIDPLHTQVINRNSDIRAVHSRTGMKLKRWCRDDEVVWCALKTPIPGPNGTSIRFWPGLVEEMNVKPVARNRPDSSGTKKDEPWDILQYTVYKVRLLAVSCAWKVDDEQVLPYQAYHLPSPLLRAIEGVPSSALNVDRNSSSQFNPCPDMLHDPSGSNLRHVTFEDAAGPFALAVQIAAQITQLWGLTDDWRFRYTIPQSSSPSSSQPGPSVPTLQDVISSASTSNAAAMNGALKLPHPLSNREANISASRATSPATLTRLSNQVLGVPNPLNPDTGPSHTITETRCQGLWWGSERIWEDDWVRIKLPRSALAPDGAPHILAPAKVSKRGREICKDNGFPEEGAGAQSRGVFMRLNALRVVEVPTSEDGRKKKECRAAGMLYELADEDWVEADQGGIHVNGIGSTPAPPPSLFGAVDLELLPNATDVVPQPLSSQPSPLKPNALPNPDPAVPIEATSSNILSQQGLPPTTTPRKRRGAGSNASTPPQSQDLATTKGGNLSQPLDPYLMPDAPKGYKFRPILDEGYEAVFSLTMISGRYYPGILSHPLLDEYISEASQSAHSPIPVDAAAGSLDNEGMGKWDVLWALEGLAPGYKNSVDPVSYKATRKKMVETADEIARTQMEAYKAKRERGNPDDIMEVDQQQPIGAVMHHPMEVDAPA